MAKISLTCEQCGGNIILDDSHEIGTCEYCYAQFVIKEDKIIQKITQHITKHVYGYQGKDVEELLTDGYKFLELGDYTKANVKFRRAIDIEPDCWSAWFGYAGTGGDHSGYLAKLRAYRRAYAAARGEQQEVDTFVGMVGCLPDQHLRSAFVRKFNTALKKERPEIFQLVSNVVGCDESEMATLAIDLCPDDWRAHFAMAKFRQIRARWCELERGGFRKKHLPAHAAEVAGIFRRAYRLAKSENEKAQQTILSYVDNMAKDNSYSVFFNEVKKQIQEET